LKIKRNTLVDQIRKIIFVRKLEVMGRHIDKTSLYLEIIIYIVDKDFILTKKNYNEQLLF